MIKLSMEANEQQLTVRFDLPDQPGQTLNVAELAIFSLYLDAIKQRVIDLTTGAIAKGSGYDLATQSGNDVRAKLAEPGSDPTWSPAVPIT